MRRRKWFLLFFANCVICILLFIFKCGSTYNVLLSAKENLLLQWYPHWGAVLFYLVQATMPLLGVLLVINGILFLFFLITTIPKKWGNYRRGTWVKSGRSFTIYLLIIFVSLITTEFIFRKVFNVIPGVGKAPTGLKRVEVLKMKMGYTADSTGIYKIDYNAAKTLEGDMTREGMRARDVAESEDFHDQLLQVYDQARVLYNPETTFAFALHCKHLAKRADLDTVDSAVIDYSRHPFNTNGFRSIEFLNYATKRKKILLLGDSFTFGQEPDNIFQSFADCLLAKDMVVYNSGITSTDPPQYLAIAKKYLAKLQPDYVVVNLCMANDVYYYRRPLSPGVPICYSTNAGDLYSKPLAQNFYQSAQQAYDSLWAATTIPAQRTVLYPLYTKTALGTVLWQFFEKINWVKAEPRQVIQPYHQMHYPSCNDDLKEIKSIADSNNCKLIIIAIPAYTDTGLTKVSDYPNLLTGMKYYIAPVDKQDYETRTRHYNNTGHKKHADFIIKLME